MTDLTELVARLRECPWEITDEAADAIEAQAREIAALTARAEAAEAKVGRLTKALHTLRTVICEVFPALAKAKVICQADAALAEIGGGNG